MEQQPKPTPSDENPTQQFFKELQLNTNPNWQQRLMDLYTGEPKNLPSTGIPKSPKNSDSHNRIVIRGAINGDSLLKLTILTNFCCQFASTANYIWITSLLMHYHISRRLDCVLWAVPVLMSLLAKPFLDSYIQSFNVPIERMKNPLVFHLLCAALGLYMVASSTFIELYVDLEALRVSYTNLRIVVACIGWIGASFNVEMAFMMSDYIRASIFDSKVKYNCSERRLMREDQSIALLARLTCLFCAVMVGGEPYSFQHLFQQLGIVYNLAAIICFLVAMQACVLTVVFIVLDDKQNKKRQKQNKNHKLMSPTASQRHSLHSHSLHSHHSRKLLNRGDLTRFQVLKRNFGSLHLSYILKGLRIPHFSSIKLKRILTIIFCYTCVIDITFCYSISWIIFNTSSRKYSDNYILGVGVGAKFLIMMFLVATYSKGRFRSKVRGKEDMTKSVKRREYISFGIEYLTCILLNLIFTFMTAVTDSVVFMGIMIFLNGWLLGYSEFYVQKKQSSLLQNYSEYQRSQSVIYSYQKFFLRVVVPIYFYLNNQRIVDRCLWVSVVLLSIMAGIRGFDVVKTKNTKPFSRESQLDYSMA